MQQQKLQQHRQRCVELQYLHPTWYGGKSLWYEPQFELLHSCETDHLAKVVRFAEHWLWLVRNLFSKAHSRVSRRCRSKPGIRVVGWFFTSVRTQSRRKNPPYPPAGGSRVCQGPHVALRMKFSSSLTKFILMFSQYLWRYSCKMKSTGSVVT